MIDSKKRMEKGEGKVGEKIKLKSLRHFCFCSSMCTLSLKKTWGLLAKGEEAVDMNLSSSKKKGENYNFQ